MSNQELCELCKQPIGATNDVLMLPSSRYEGQLCDYVSLHGRCYRVAVRRQEKRLSWSLFRIVKKTPTHTQWASEDGLSRIDLIKEVPHWTDNFPFVWRASYKKLRAPNEHFYWVDRKIVRNSYSLIDTMRHIHFQMEAHYEPKDLLEVVNEIIEE